MQTSSEIGKLFPAIVKAQAQVKAAAKDATNPHFKSKYADLGAVWEAVSEALRANDLAIIQAPGEVIEGKLHIHTRLIHSSGEWLESLASTPLPKQDPQGYGSAVTYLRRYVISALMGVVGEDDDGNGASVHGNGSPYVKMPAKFPGKCAICSVVIEQGDEQMYNRESKKAAHIACYEERTNH